jgi:hypothetical protein
LIGILNLEWVVRPPGMMDATIPDVDVAIVLMVNFRQPSHEFTFNVGINLLF